MEESMKKVILLALVAMMLLSMFAMSACKPKPQEEPMEEEILEVEEAPEIVDTLAVEEGVDAAPIQ